MSRETTVIGSPTGDFWLYSPDTGFDLTHPDVPEAPPVHPRLPLQTTTDPITIDPAKSALVIIDMQNFFLSPALGEPSDSKGIRACDQLLQHAIPACRRAGVRIVWLNWGLTDREIDEMPPATLKSFAFRHIRRPHTAPDEAKEPADGVTTAVATTGSHNAEQPRRLRAGLGSDMGQVELEDGSKVEAGRMLVRDQWNTQLYPPLEAARRQGMHGRVAWEDVWIHKNRMSGFWGAETPATRYFESLGIKTLLFAGVNTDQCVSGSLTDAYTRGYDCIMLRDACATTTPEEDGGRACVEYNASRVWGFSLNCQDLTEGVEKMILQGQPAE